MAGVGTFPSQMSSACLLDVIRNLLVISEQNSTVRPACCTLLGEACLNLLVELVEAYLHVVMALLTLRRIPSISTPPVSSVNPMMLFLCTHKWVCHAWAQHTVSSLLSFARGRAILTGSVKTLHVLVVADWEYVDIWLNDSKLMYPITSVLGDVLFDHSMSCNWISGWLWKWLLNL